jgi:hypothetical protein
MLLTPTRSDHRSCMSATNSTVVHVLPPQPLAAHTRSCVASLPRSKNSCSDSSSLGSSSPACRCRCGRRHGREARLRRTLHCLGLLDARRGLPLLGLHAPAQLLKLPRRQLHDIMLSSWWLSSTSPPAFIFVSDPATHAGGLLSGHARGPRQRLRLCCDGALG